MRHPTRSRSSERLSHTCFPSLFCNTHADTPAPRHTDISGTPGTGKTATVHAVVRTLKRLSARGLTNPFTYVEVNGLRLPEPNAAYGVVWDALCGGGNIGGEEEGTRSRMSSKEALKRLGRYFASGGEGPGGGAW